LKESSDGDTLLLMTSDNLEGHSAATDWRNAANDWLDGKI